MNKRKRKAIDMVLDTADWLDDSESRIYENPESIEQVCNEGASRLASHSHLDFCTYEFGDY